MKRILALLLLLTIAACGGAEQQIIDANQEGAPDINVEQKDDTTEVTIDMEEVVDEEVLEIIDDIPEDYCKPGSTFEYKDEQSTSESIIIGLAQYKGAEWCQAESTTIIDSPVGEITAETTYYFDKTFREYWVITTTSGPMPAQTTEVHIVDGEVV